jgi:hypothetical protein
MSTTQKFSQQPKATTLQGSNVQKEEKKEGSTLATSGSTTGSSTLEGGIMPRMDLWKDFDDWYKSIFEDFSTIDKEMDKRFRDFSDSMFKNQER